MHMKMNVNRPSLDEKAGRDGIGIASLDRISNESGSMVEQDGRKEKAKGSMTLRITLNNNKRIQRKRVGDVICQNDKNANGKVIAKFYDKWEFDNKCNPVPFAECPLEVIKIVRGIIPVVSTFAK